MIVTESFNDNLKYIKAVHDVFVEGIKVPVLSFKSESVKAGDILEVETTSDGAVTFTSSDATVVAITEGVPTAVGAGTATVKATVAPTESFEKREISATITVSKIDATCSFASEGVSMTVGEAVPTNALTCDSDGTKHWSSSNEEVATVEDGVVTPVASATGETTITVTVDTTSVYKAAEASYVLTINAAEEVL